MAAVTPSAFLDGRYANYNESDNSVVGTKPRYKVGYVTVATTTDTSDTIAVNFYEEFGISKVLAVWGCVMSDTSSVFVEEAPTTTVDREKLTITVGGTSLSDRARFYAIYGI